VPSTKTFLALILALAGLSFNLAAAPALAPVPRTGQTPTTPLNPAPPGADGALEKGVDWPSPRFIDNADGTITDTLTDLVWLKNANCTDTVGGVKKNVGLKPGTLPWSQSLTWSNALATGKCGLSDGSAAGDWRLPNLRELYSLVDLSQNGPAIPADHPFLQVKPTTYWSSSTIAPTTGQAWNLNFGNADTGRIAKTSRQLVWPVRDASAQSPPAPKIGDTYQGGIIFYIDGSGQHGLIAAAQDQSNGIRWGDVILNGISTGATATAFGTGQANTDKIIAAQDAGDYAASLADNLVLNGYSDWFLPSRDELNLMYANIGPGAAAPLTNIGGFSSTWYWSSSEVYLNAAWLQHLENGLQHYDYKYYLYAVRAVRAF